MGKGWILRAAACACLALAATAGAAPDRGAEDGARAPRDAWGLPGGGAARTGAAATEPLRGPVRTAWDRTLPGVLVGEPLVEGPHVVVEVAERAGVRALHLLSLRDGTTLEREVFRTDLPLLPSISHGVVLVRAAATRLEAYRMRGGKLTRFWNLDRGEPVSAPLLHGTEVYLRTPDALERFRLGGREPQWTRRGKFRGLVSLRGPHVYCVEYDSEGSSSLCLLRRADGELAGSTGAGHHMGKVPAPEAAIEIVVLPEEILVRHALPVPLADGGEALAAQFRRVGDRVVLVGFLERVGAVAETPDGWVAVLHSEENGGTQLVESVKDGAYVLADRSHQPGYLARAARPTSARGVLYLAGSAVDSVSGRILWANEYPDAVVAVPARHASLVVAARDRLVALTGSGPASDELPWTAALETAVEGRTSLRDGTVLNGELAFPGDGTVVHRRGRAASAHPLDEVLCAEDGTGRLLAAAPGEDALRGFDLLVSAELGSRYAQLAADAGAARDAALLERLLSEARQHGAEDAELAPAETALKALARRKRAAEPDARRVQAVLTAERELGAVAAERLARSVERLPEEAPFALRADLLRALLRRDPAHAQGIAHVRALIPAGIVPPEPFAALEWLDFAEAVRQVPVRLVPQPNPKDPDLTNAQRLLGSLQHTWRPDLVGIETDGLLVVTPLARPGSIARCLSMGELVCETLARLCADGTRRRADSFPLTIQLFESEEEYVAQSTRRGADPGIAWTAGHYDSMDEVSRLYLPSDQDAFDRVRSVFAHELTHQWIDERCPLFGTADRRNEGADTPAYWIVEGFASMVDEMRFDLHRRTAELDPRADALLTVAGAPAGRLIPWGRLFAMDYEVFDTLDRESEIQYPDPWRLGFRRRISETRLFYDQAAAACHYLYEAEGGRHRAALLEYLARRYCGDPQSLEEAFGMGAEELGAKVLAYVRERTAL